MVSTSSRCASSPASVWQTRGRRRNCSAMNSAATSRKRLLTAEWLYTATAPATRGKGVVITDDKIVAVDDVASLNREHPDAEPIDFGSAIILPGLVNPHIHLELSNCNATDAAGLPFEDWILTIPARSG